MNEYNSNDNYDVFAHVRIIMRITTLRQEFYLATREQIESYSDMGFFVSLFLTLFGLFGGGSISCWVGAQQSNIPESLLSTIYVALLFCALSTTLFLALSIVFIVKQRAHKKTILQSYVETGDLDFRSL
jgi:apolipoprotein N-acyltransferase